MAANDDISNSAKAMGDLIESQKAVQKSIDMMNVGFTQSTKAVLELAVAMKKMLGESSNDLEIMLDDMGELEISLDTLGEKSKKAQKDFGSFTELFDYMGKKLKKAHPALIGFAVGAVSGLVQGFKNVVAIGKGVLGFLENVAETAFNVGAAIIAIPFKLFNTLVDMAEKGGGGTELAQAYENVRKEFGSFKNEMSSTVISVSKELKDFNQTGLSSFRIFGNMAERLELVTKLAVAMGPVFGKLSKEFKEHGGAILAYQKGLGVTDEEMRALGERALGMGEDIRDGLNEVTKYTLQFNGGVVNKTFSKDMVKAMVDVKHFGGATIKEIGRSTAYAKALGTELTKIVGVMDAFNTFDQAAENAAKLGQSFGMVVDSFKMVKAQSPDEQLDMLRESFRKTGKSVKDFSRQDFQLMAQTTGLSEDIVRLAMSEKNRGKSLKELEKDAQKAKNSELSQAKAMSKLADSIERLVKSGELSGGFFDQFLKGIKLGMQQCEPFWRLMMNIKKALMTVYYEGIKLGRWIMGKDGLKGVREFVGALADFFDPKKFKAVFGGIADVFKTACTDLLSGKKSFPEVMNMLKKKFFDFFDDQTGPGKKLLALTKKALKSVTKIFAEALKWLSTKLTEGLKWISAVLSGKVDMGKYMTAGAEGGGFFMELVKPLWEAIKTSWRPLFEALSELMGIAWRKLVTYFKSSEFQAIAKPALVAMMAVLFGPAVMQGIMGAVTGALSKYLLKMLSGALLKAAPQAASAAAPKVASLFGSIVGYATGIGAVLAVTTGISAGMKMYKGKMKSEFSDAEKTIAAGTTGLIDSLTLGLLPEFLGVALANWGAEMLKKFEEKLNSIMSNMGTRWVEVIAGNVEVLKGIGDVVIGIFTLDISRVGEGLVSILGGMFKSMLAALKFMTIDMVTRTVRFIFTSVYELSVYSTKTVGKILQKMGLEKLGEVFIRISGITQQVWGVIKLVGGLVSAFFGTFSALVGQAFDDLMEVPKQAIEIFSNLYDTVKGFIGTLLSSASTMAPIMKYMFGPMIAGIKLVWDFAKKAYTAVTDWINGAFIVLKDVINKAGSTVVRLTDAFLRATAAIEKARGKGPLGGSKDSKKAAKDAAEQNINLQKEGMQEGVDEESKKPGIDISAALKGLATGKFDENTFEAPVEAINRVQDLEQKMSTISKEKMDDIRKRLSDVFDPRSGMFTGVMDDLQKSQANLAMINSSLEPVLTMTTGISNKIKSALGAAADIVKAANELDKALSDGNVNKMNVQAKLQKVANAVGLKGAKYTIENKMVQITLNLSVSMDPLQVEDAIIHKSTSVIRDRLNSIPGMKTNGTEDNNRIKTTGVPVLVSPGVP